MNPMPKYRIGYRYLKTQPYKWGSFNYLSQIKQDYYFIIKNSNYFKIFVLKGDKYISLCNKTTFMWLLKRQVVKKFSDANQRTMLMRNMRSFKEAIELSFTKGTKS